MERITLLDTSVGSTNLGDEIIMRCFKEEMADILKNSFILSVPTHLRSFSCAQAIGKLPDTASEVRRSNYKFACGTNLLMSNFFHRSNQWDLSLLSCRPLSGTVLVGVGGKIKLPKGLAGWYTKKVYARVLSKDYMHSVRTDRAKEALEKLGGYRAVNTGCVTLWKLTPDFCKGIHRDKADTAIVTLTDYNRNAELDRALLHIVGKNYKKVFFWPQGIYDRDYMLQLGSDAELTILPPSVDAYERVLNAYDKLDYVGTRLHGGIFAMRHKARCVILTLDERMADMQMQIPNNCMSRARIPIDLEQKINSVFSTEVRINFEAMHKWKAQFV